MNFEIEGITEDKEWDDLVLQFPEYSFLNSSARIKYNGKVYRKSGRFGVRKNDKIIALCNWFVSNSRFPYLYTQHSPLCMDYTGNDEILDFIVNELKRIAIENNCVYIELGPLSRKKINVNNGILAPVANIDALITLHINVLKSIGDLRADMSASSKNTVNKLLKDSRLKVKIYNDNSQIDLFLRLLKETQQDKGFSGKSDEKFRNELSHYAENGMLYFIVGYLEGEPIGMRVNIKFGAILTDYQACISSKAREQNIRIAYLLAYKTMLLAKDLNCRTWDMFGGMGVDKARNHPWRGIEEFKRSFGGEKIIYTHPVDIPMKITYLLSYFYHYILTVTHKFTTKW